MKVIYTTEPIEKGKQSIFLAGPSPRSDNVSSWRSDAIKYLEDIGFDGIVYNPEHRDGQAGFAKAGYPADWEHEAIESSTVLVFWIPRDMETMPALTTNVEFGYFVDAHSIMLYGRPDNAPKNRYLDWLFHKKRPYTPIYKQLNPLMQEAFEMANIKNYEN